jgi:adenylate cyclase
MDVAGYSRLVAADEEATLTALRRHRADFTDPKIAGYRGRIANTAGDSILSEFPSVVDALRCVIDIQRGMVERNAHLPADRRILFRAGINLGDVFEQDGDLLGDGVNLAARLEGVAEPGGVCLSAAAYEQVRGRVEAAFEDLGPKTLKNIPMPVHVWRVALDGQAAPPRRSLRRPALALLALLLLAAAGAGLWQFQPRDGGGPAPATDIATPADKPSIAVLPFTNMSNDTEQEYFSDGVTDDLITDLSRISGLFVIARNTVFTYKGRAVNVTQVARELGVRYVLEGSVRKAGERVRINAQLIDTATGGHVWADRFDRELGDIFALQDDVTREIVSALALELTTDERTQLLKADPETSPDVYDLYLRGTEALRQYTPESIEQARTYYLRALSLDPDYARAYAAMAFTYTASGIFFRSADIERDIAEALRYGERAMQLDATLPQAHFAMAIAWLRKGEHDKARTSAERAVRYDPNYSDGYAALSNILFFSGDGEGAVRAMRRAMRLNPRYSAAYIDILGRAYFVLGDYEKAITEFRECIARDPALITCHSFLAATYGLMGRIDEAQWEAEEIRGLEPDFTLKTDNVVPQFLVRENRDRYRDGLRRAGIPES